MRAVSFIALVLISLIPFGIRIIVYQFTPGFHEYEAVSLYVSDAALLALIGALVVYWYGIRKRPQFRNRKYSTLQLFSRPFAIALAVFLGFAAVSVFLATSSGLAFYTFVRLVFLIGSAFAIAVAVQSPRFFERILLIFSIIAVMESILGIVQFKLQGDAGLQFFGESHIGADVLGTSKVAIGGIHLVRAYGTFPHPNILSAFLVLGLISLFHFYFHTESDSDRVSRSAGSYYRLIIAASIFVVSTGIVLTFSRTAWLIGFAVTLPFILYGLYLRETAAFDVTGAVSRWRLSRFWFTDAPALPEARRRQAASLKFLVILIAVNYFLFAALGWASLPRAEFSANEPAVFYRVAYNKLGYDLIRAYPFGVGIGNQVFEAHQHGFYKRRGMAYSWQWQPIHNIYLLMASEIGLLGLFGFLLFLGFLIRRIVARPFRLKRFTVTMFLGAILLFGLTDHFFWTIEQGRLMLWLTIGLAFGIAFGTQSRADAQTNSSS